MLGRILMPGFKCVMALRGRVSTIFRRGKVSKSLRGAAEFCVFQALAALYASNVRWRAHRWSTIGKG